VSAPPKDVAAFPPEDDEAPPGSNREALDPPEAYPFPVTNRDLSDGLLDYRIDGELYAARSFITEVVVIRWLRIGVAVVLVLVLAGLGAALASAIGAFTRQVDKATPEMRHLVEVARDAAPAASALSGQTVNAALPASGASAPVVLAAVEPPATLTTSVKVDVASMAGTIVAVISILVVAISVIAISLLQATFKLTPHRSDEPQGERKSDEGKDSKKDPDGGIPLPAKEAAKFLYECLKPIFGKGDK